MSKKRTKRRFDDKFRASVVLMLQAAGYTGDPKTNKKGALARVAKEVDVSYQLISKWFTAEVNPPPQNILHEKKIDFVQAIENEMSAILGEMDNARQDATYSQLGTVFGIMTDKRQLLTSNPTEISQSLSFNVNYGHSDKPTDPTS